MADDETRKGMRVLLAEGIDASPLGWWYLSFADGKLPTGTQFLGAIVVRARGFLDAVRQTHRRGINPGGEVQGVDVPAEWNPPEAFVNRLLSREDIAEMDRQIAARDGEFVADVLYKVDGDAPRLSVRPFAGATVDGSMKESRDGTGYDIRVRKLKGPL